MDDRFDGIALAVAVLGCFFLIGFIVHDHYETRREAFRHGYVEVQNVGNPSDRWVKP